MLDRLTPADFAPLVGATLSAGPPALELLEVKAVRDVPAPPGVRAEPFTLLLLARVPGYVPQGVYPLEHPGLGRLDVFLVPVGRSPDGAILEAVFN